MVVLPVWYPAMCRKEGGTEASGAVAQPRPSNHPPPYPTAIQIHRVAWPQLPLAVMPVSATTPCRPVALVLRLRALQPTCIPKCRLTR